MRTKGQTINLFNLELNLPEKERSFTSFTVTR